MNEFGLKSTCLTKTPNMQHDSSSKEVGRIGLKERETELSSREGEGGQNLSLQTRERRNKENGLILGSKPLI